MTFLSAQIRNSDGAISDRRSDALICFCLALLALVPPLFDGSLINWPSDNDSMLRLVQIRDLLAGQAWFDYTQYRMGLDGGFQMHWSRIVDLPVAIIILAVSATAGSAVTGEMAAGIIWPNILLMISIYAIVRTVRALGGEQATLPALIVGAMTLYSIGIFAPGMLDHHNLQLTVCLMALWALVAGSKVHHGFGAGAAIAVTMAVGMETLPIVAVACGVVAMSFLATGPRYSNMATGFGLGFAATTALAFLATVGPSNWSTIHCDALSPAQLSIAALGGLGLAASAHFPAIAAFPTRRTAALGGLAVLLALLVGLAYPQCVAGPYSGLDERLKTLWLASIGEAQPITSIWVKDPVNFAKYYATPLAAVAVLVTILVRQKVRRDWLTVAAFLGVTVAVSFWQVRGGNFAVAFAVIPLAVWVGEKRNGALQNTGIRASLVMVLAWIIALNTSWTVAAKALRDAAVSGSQHSRTSANTQNGSADCYDPLAFTDLAVMTQQTMVAVSNMGPVILKLTPHRVLAGPYHRNVRGNIATLDAFMGTPEQARSVLRQNNVDVIIHCPDEGEAKWLAKVAPGGLLAAIDSGNPPTWLHRLNSDANSSIQIYRISTNRY